MKCSKCNQEIEDTNAFCPFCGEPVKKEENVEQETVAPEENVKPEESSQQEEQEKVQESVNEVKEVEKEVVKEKTNEVVKENTVTEVKTNEVKKEDNKNNSNSQNKKRHSVITMLVLGIIAIAIILIVILALVFTTKSPEKLYKDFIDSALSSLYTGDASTASSANITSTVEMTTTIDELKDAINGLKVNVNAQYDIATKQMVFGLNLDQNSDSYIAAKAMLDANNNAIYVNESNLYDKNIKLDVPEEYKETLNEIFAQSESVNKSAQKKAANKISDAINNNLPKEKFTKENVVVNINGKDKKVKDNTLTLTVEEFKTALENAANSLKLDNEFLDLYANRDEIIASLDMFIDSLDELSYVDGTIAIHYYTSGLTNKFVGVAVVIDDSSTEAIFELINTEKNVYELNLKATNYGETQDILSAKITVNKSTDTEKDMLVSVNIPDAGTIDFKILATAQYDKGIEVMDTNNSVAYEEMTQEDMEKISENYQNSKLYEVLSAYGLNLDGSLGGSDYTDDRDVPAGITLKQGQSFVQSYDDDTVIFNVPNSLEEEYAGLSYQSFSKQHNTKSTAYIDVDVNWDTLEEYEDSITSLAEYYTEEDGYRDVKVTDREEVEIAGNTYYKRVFSYTYGTGSYSYTSVQTYYYLPITDEYVYSVEIDDDDGIVTDSDIEKLLTIDVVLH